jgi:proteic killer suppression protein
MLTARRIKHKGLKLLYAKGDESKINPKWLDKVKRILGALSIAGAPSEMNFPGFGYHELKQDREGTHACWVTRNQRVTFEWDSEGPFNVDLEDYHGRRRAG